MKEFTALNIRSKQVFFLAITFVLGVCLFPAIADGRANSMHILLTVKDENGAPVADAPVYYKIMWDGKSPDNVSWSPWTNISSHPARHNKTLRDGVHSGVYYHEWGDDRSKHRVEVWVKVTKGGYKSSIAKFNFPWERGYDKRLSRMIIMEQRN